MNQLLGLTPGATVGCGGRRYVITHILSLEAILAKDQDDGRSIELKVCDITAPIQLSTLEKTAGKDLALIEEKDWTMAEQWFSRLYPLLSGRRTDEMVRAVAKEAGVHRTTIYRKLSLYEQGGRVSDLIPTKSSGGKGHNRLAPEVEAIIASVLREFYLTKQKRSIKCAVDEIRRIFASTNLTSPHYNTIRNRVLAIPERVKDKERLGHKVARESMMPFPDSFRARTGRWLWSRSITPSSTSCWSMTFIVAVSVDPG
jgi:putative transposase